MSQILKYIGQFETQIPAKSLKLIWGSEKVSMGIRFDFNVIFPFLEIQKDNLFYTCFQPKRFAPIIFVDNLEMLPIYC